MAKSAYKVKSRNSISLVSFEMFNKYFGIVVFTIFMMASANYFSDVFKCNDFLLKCQESETKVGKYNATTNSFNKNCSLEIGSKWSNLTRCELQAAICLLGQMNRLDVNCENIADVMQL
ncbi:uncharacterized protein LOC116655921 [Drosophila ananassae]|uniref:uncharacterized protein LOC116655921 n=1 Tax=Drosophila ananassae TaxID=7217 RepID=UPI001D000640|nr:uncharacterized protein LOC116655921 [Drosophila ananassae]